MTEYPSIVTSDPRRIFTRSVRRPSPAMATEPNTPQPLIPFKMPHLTPVLDAPSPLIPESAAFMNFQVFQTEKANLEFMPVKFRTPEHRARLVVVKAQCEELEKQVMLERMEAQIVQLRQEIKALARPRKQGRTSGQIGARTRKQRLADREVLAAKQAELSKLEAAQAELNSIPTVTELHDLTRNQFLKMVGMSVLAFTVWNKAAAFDIVLPSDSISAYPNTSRNWSGPTFSGSWWSSSSAKDEFDFLSNDEFDMVLAAAAKPKGSFALMPMSKGSNWCWACVAACVGNYTGTYRGGPCDLMNLVFVQSACCTPITPTTPLIPACDQDYSTAVGLWTAGVVTLPAQPKFITGVPPFPTSMYAGKLLPGTAQPPWANLMAMASINPSFLLVVSVTMSVPGSSRTQNHAFIVKVNATAGSFTIEDPGFGTIGPVFSGSSLWPNFLTPLATRWHTNDPVHIPSNLVLSWYSGWWVL